MFIKFDWFRLQIAAQFSALLGYHRHAEAQIQESHHALRMQIKIEAGQPTHESEEAFREWEAQHRSELESCDHRFQMSFARLHRYSLLVMAFSLVEDSLPKIAKEMVRRSATGETFGPHNDVTAMLAEFKKFWTNHACPALPTGGWGRVDDLHHLRNCIVHDRGFPTDADDRASKRKRRIDDIIARKEGIRYFGSSDPLPDPDEYGSIVISDAYCEHMLMDLIPLFDAIFDQAGCFGSDEVTIIP